MKSAVYCVGNCVSEGKVCVDVCILVADSPLGVSSKNLNKGHCGGEHTPWSDPTGTQEVCMMEIPREVKITE